MSRSLTSDTSTPPQTSQGSRLNPNEAAASLAFVTQLRQGMLAQPSQNKEFTPQDMEETAQPSQETEQEQANPMAELQDIKDEIIALKEEIKANAPKDKDQEIADLKKQIEEVLNSD